MYGKKTDKWKINRDKTALFTITAQWVDKDLNLGNNLPLDWSFKFGKFLHFFRNFSATFGKVEEKG